MHKILAVLGTTALIASLGLVAPGAAQSVDNRSAENLAGEEPTQRPLASPRALPAAAGPISGTPAEILQEIPVTEPLVSGYQGSFIPAKDLAKKDAKGCNARGQLLIKMASKKPRVGRKCLLTGGEWLVDFGTKKIKKAKDVKIGKLLPDSYVYAQGAFGWTPQQRATYASNYAPNTSLPKATRANLGPFLENTSIQLYSKSGLRAIEPAQVVLARSLAQRGGAVRDEAVQRDLDALRERNPKLFDSWTVATLLNAKAWGLSLNPGTSGNFAVTIEKCADEEAPKGVQNPCSTTYSVPNEAAKYNIVAVPMTASIVPIQVTKTGAATSPFFEYGAPSGRKIDRFMFGIHAPADWVSDVETGVNEPIKPETIPNVPVGYLRLWDTETTWRDLEPTKGQWEWRKLNKQIEMAQILNARVMLVLGGTPEWAGDGSVQSKPKSLADWRTYVRTVACKYGPSITSYEVWNEANLTTFWKGTPVEMADLTAAAFEEIRGCNPSALVVAANTTSRATGSFGTFYPEYLQALKARNWPVDAYSVHSYPTASGGANDRIRGIGQFRTMLALAGAPQTTVFDSEINYGLAGLGEDKRALTGANAMTLMSRTFIDSARYGFGSTFWFVWTANPDSKFGIQFTRNATDEQQAWRTTYDWLVDSEFQRCFETQDKIVICQFNKGADNFSIVWRGDYQDGLFTTTPGYFARLGSRMCNLYGSCESMSVNSPTTISPMPMRIDGAPLVTGTSDADTAPPAPQVKDAQVVYPESGGATFSANITPASGSSVRISEYRIKLTACAGKSDGPCRTVGEATMPGTEQGFTYRLADDVSGYVSAEVTAVNTAGASKAAKSDPVLVGFSSLQKVTGLDVLVSDKEEVRVTWNNIPVRPNVGILYEVAVLVREGQDWKPRRVSRFGPEVNTVDLGFDQFGDFLIASGQEFRICVSVIQRGVDQGSQCRDGVLSGNLPRPSDVRISITPEREALALITQLPNDPTSVNVRGYEVQYQMPGSTTWRAVPATGPTGAPANFIPAEATGPKSASAAVVNLRDDQIWVKALPAQFRVRAVSWPGRSGGSWVLVKPFAPGRVYNS